MSGPQIMFGRTLVKALVEKASVLTGVPVEEILGGSLSEDARLTRFAIMRAAFDAGRSTAQIARVLNLHHTTVQHGLKRSLALAETDPDFARLVEELAA